MTRRTPALVRALRPKQWVKNVLVFAAPGAAGALDEASVLVDTLIAFAVFCAAASATYLLNDTLDAEHDRRHPVKRHRPIAAGELSEARAALWTVVLAAGAIGVSFMVRWELAATVVAYMVLTFCYSQWLKHLPILDLAAVTAGFVLRAAAGGAATGIPISRWFFIVTSAASLFLIGAKRYAECRTMGADAGTTRPALGGYTIEFLNLVRSVSVAVSVMAYALWSFESADLADARGADAGWLYQASAVPFVLALLRYALAVDQGKGEEPEEIVMNDRVLQLYGALWVAVYAGAVYVN